MPEKVKIGLEVKVTLREPEWFWKPIGIILSIIMKVYMVTTFKIYKLLSYIMQKIMVSNIEVDEVFNEMYEDKPCDGTGYR